MARVEIAPAAIEDLGRLVATLALPADTMVRVQRSLRPLEQFPRLGPELPGRWAGHRFIVGPWRWLIAVYRLAEHDRVAVVAFHDVRSSSAATST